jgi:hypothetical protein
MYVIGTEGGYSLLRAKGYRIQANSSGDRVFLGSLFVKDTDYDASIDYDENDPAAVANMKAALKTAEKHYLYSGWTLE